MATPRSVVTRAAVQLVEGADTAHVLLIGEGGSFESLAATGDLPRRLDVLRTPSQGSNTGLIGVAERVIAPRGT